MPPPTKRYYRLAELAERWGVQIADIACHVLDEELEISVLTIALSAEVGRFEETPDGILAVPEETITLVWATTGNRLRSACRVPRRR